MSILVSILQAIEAMFQAIPAAWLLLTWHSTTGAILVPLAVVAASLVLSRAINKGGKHK